MTTTALRFTRTDIVGDKQMCMRVCIDLKITEEEKPKNNCGFCSGLSRRRRRSSASSFFIYLLLPFS